MFDPNQFLRREQVRRSVSVALADGTALEGNLMVPLARTIAEVLNGRSAFFEFETDHGEKIFLSKSAIRSVRPTDLPKREPRGRRSVEPQGATQTA